MRVSVIRDDILARLPPVARDHALYLEEARQRRDAFGIIVWAAVLLEAILEDVLRDRGDEIGAGKDRDDLGGLIKRLEPVVKGDGRVAAEVLEAAHSVRVNRNRAVHHTGRRKLGLENAATKTCDELRLILEWWSTRKTPSASALVAWIGRVFLASITPNQPRHRGFLADIRQELIKRELEPVTVELTEYDRRAPLAAVSQVMRHCDAVLIVGLERSRAFHVRDREGSDSESDAFDRRYSSSWLHMEGGLAYGLGLGDRVFVLCEPGIHGDGVFDADWNQYQRVEIADLDVDSAPVRQTLERLVASIQAARPA